MAQKVSKKGNLPSDMIPKLGDTSGEIQMNVTPRGIMGSTDLQFAAGDTSRNSFLHNGPLRFDAESKACVPAYNIKKCHNSKLTTFFKEASQDHLGQLESVKKYLEKKE